MATISPHCGPSVAWLLWNRGVHRTLDASIRDILAHPCGPPDERFLPRCGTSVTPPRSGLRPPPGLRRSFPASDPAGQRQSLLGRTSDAVPRPFFGASMHRALGHQVSSTTGPRNTVSPTPRFPSPASFARSTLSTPLVWNDLPLAGSPPIGARTAISAGGPPDSGSPPTPPKPALHAGRPRLGPH